MEPSSTNAYLKKQPICQVLFFAGHASADFWVGTIEKATVPTAGSCIGGFTRVLGCLADDRSFIPAGFGVGVASRKMRIWNKSFGICISLG